MFGIKGLFRRASVPAAAPTASAVELNPGDPGFNEQHREVLELLNTEFSERLKRQSDSGARIDTKAGLLAGFAATALQFQAHQKVAHPALGWFAVGAYGLAFASAVLAFMVRPYKDLLPGAMIGEYLLLDKPTAVARLVQARIGIFNENAGRHQFKARSWQTSVLLLAVGLALSLGALIHHTGSHGPKQPVSKPTSTANASPRPGSSGVRSG